MACLLFAAPLAGCQPDLRVDLLNETGVAVQVVDNRDREPSLETVQNHKRILLTGSNPMVVYLDGVERKYTWHSLPKKKGYVRLARRGEVISLELGDDGKVYLLEPGQKAATTRAVPQIAPFPISPDYDDDETHPR